MRPRLAFVVACGPASSPVGRVVEAVRAQTLAAEVELVVVRASRDAPTPAPTDAGALVRLVVVDDLDAHSPDSALAAGVEAAVAPVVCLVEDHAFPVPDCAERLLAAFDGPWDVVGCAIESANVGTARLARAGMYVSYGTWAVPVVPSEQEQLPNHNVAYRREALVGRDALGSLLERTGPLHSQLRAEGRRFFQSEARVLHVNPSGLRGAFTVRFAAGRLYAGDRAREGSWGAARRVAFALGSPLIPLVRLRRIAATRFGARERELGLWPSLAPWALLLLAADAAGQAVGYVAGRGPALERLVDAERRRERYLNRSDRRAFFG